MWRTDGALDTQLFGLTVDALGTGALVIHRVVEWPLPIQRHTHLATELPIEIFDAAFAFGKLGMLTRLASRLGREQRATKALSAVAVGMGELERGMHAPALQSRSPRGWCSLSKRFLT